MSRFLGAPVAGLSKNETAMKVGLRLYRSTLFFQLSPASGLLRDPFVNDLQENFFS